MVLKLVAFYAPDVEDPSSGTVTHTSLTHHKNLEDVSDPYIELADDPGELAGLRVENGALVRADLAPLKAAAQARADATMAATRGLYVTDLPAQQMIYQAKEAEAVAYLALEPEPTDLTGFPFLANEVGITAATAAELAQLWVAMSDQWRSIAGALESIRLTHKAAITAAATEAEVAAADAAFLAAIEQLKAGSAPA